MTSDNVMIDIGAVNKTFISPGKTVRALSGIKMKMERGEFSVILGPSGCGKSTLLSLIAGFEETTGGLIKIDGKKITKPGSDRGFVFQDFALFPWKSVIGNIMFGLRQTGKSRKESKEIAMKFINIVGLNGFEKAYPHTLSGGMKQRVGIARALAYEPKVVLMDEPFGALDAQTRKKMQMELVGMWQKLRFNVVFVTHSVIEAVFLADNIYIMTARPGSIKKKLHVDLKRPRDFASEDFFNYRRKALSYLDEEVEKSLKQIRERNLERIN